MRVKHTAITREWRAVWASPWWELTRSGRFTPTSYTPCFACWAGSLGPSIYWWGEGWPVTTCHTSQWSTRQSSHMSQRCVWTMNHPDARGRYQPYVLELSRGRTDLAVVAAMDAVIGASVWGGVECSSRFVSSNEI